MEEEGQVKKRGTKFSLSYAANHPVEVGGALSALPVWEERVPGRGKGVGLANRHLPDLSSSNSSSNQGEL